MVGKNGPGGTTNYVYDPENCLTEAGTPSGTIRFAYDASGNRIKRTTAAAETQFLIDPNMPFAQVLEESEGVNIRSYIYGHDLLKLADPGGAEAWFAYDGLGSTRALTDANSALINQYLYEGFGNILRQSGTLKNEFLFTGEQFEAGLGMYYLRARYYEPGLGRFGQRDVWGGSIQNPFTLHKYLYTNGNPINYTDPSGQFTLIEGLTYALILGIITGIVVNRFFGEDQSLGGYLEAASIWGVLFVTLYAIAIDAWAVIALTPQGVNLATRYPTLFGWILRCPGTQYAGTALPKSDPNKFTSTEDSAQSIAKYYNGTCERAKGNGWIVSIADGKKTIKLKFMDTGSGGRENPYFKVSVPGKDAYTIDAEGIVRSTNDISETHVDLTNAYFEQIKRITTVRLTNSSDR